MKGIKVLGRIAHNLTSNVIGIGAAKCNWKEANMVKTPTRNHLGLAKTSEVTTLVGNNCIAKTDRHRVKMARVGKLWTDTDFETMKLKSLSWM